MRKHQQLDDDIHGQFDSSGSFFGGTHISGKLHVVRNILHHTKIMRKIVKANACVCVFCTLLVRSSVPEDPSFIYLLLSRVTCPCCWDVSERFSTSQSTWDLAIL